MEDIYKYPYMSIPGYVGVPARVSVSCSYTLCTGGHFEPAPSRTKKYIQRTSSFIGYLVGILHDSLGISL